MSRVLFSCVLVMALAATASVATLALTGAGAASLEARVSAATQTCDAFGASTVPATAPITPDLNAPGCVLDGIRVHTGPPDDLPPERPPVKPLQPPPKPGYHHVGTWNADVVLERATVHSSKLIGVRTRAGECFWRTSHLVFWGDDQAYWVESGLFKCGDGPQKIFVYIGWGDGSPGYVIPDFDVVEGATVTTFAEWECVNNRNLVSGGYFSTSGKVYLIQYDTRTSPCFQSDQTDNNGEAYTVRKGKKANFLVDKYTALNTRICDKVSSNWSCEPWDTAFATTTVDNLETYDLHWTANYYDWSGHGHEEAEPGGDSNDAPTVSITSPPDSSTFDSGATILFEGTASDTEDGDLTGSLVWTSNIDGLIGTGGSFSTTLSDGDHTITASVTDSGGKTGSDFVTVTVGAPLTQPALQVGIELDRNPPVYNTGETVRVMATVTDGTNAVPDATAHVTFLTPKPLSYGWDQLTDANGETTFEFTPKWKGEYTTWVDASKQGFTSGSSGQMTFTVE